MNRAQRNNNPGNLRYAEQKEAIGEDNKGFAVFPDGPAGWRALHNQIRLDKKRGLSLRKFIEKYAPPSENDTMSYLDIVANELNVDVMANLTEVSTYGLAGVIAQIEGYYMK